MSKSMITVLGIAAAGFAVLGRSALSNGPANQSSAAPGPKVVAFRDAELAPFVKAHCVACHSGERAKGKVRLDNLAKVQDRRTLAKVYHQIAARTMPPEDKPQPVPEELQRVIVGLKALLEDESALAVRPTPTAAVRRLNRKQYRNTIRDLFGIDHDPTVLMPADEINHGFDNIADALRTSPILMDRFLRMADEVARKVIITDPVEVSPVVAELEWRTAGLKKGYKNPPRYFGEKLTKPLPFAFEIPADDDYILKIQLVTDNVRDKPLTLVIERDAKEVGRMDVQAEELAWYRQKLRLSEGKHALQLRMVKPEMPRDAKVVDPPAILIEHLQVIRPSALKPEHYPESHRTILAVRPSKELLPREAARANLTKLVGRAYRRPATADHIDRLLKVFDASQKDGDAFERSIQLSIQAMLCSPNFLFILERGPGNDPGKTRPLDEFELATRLSYFLWNSTPDDELLRLAGQGTLRTDLERQTDRMIADPRFERFAESFVTQWLELNRLENFNPDPKNREFSGFTLELRQAMIREASLFFTAILRENRPLTQLIDADFTFVNPGLARIYGAKLTDPKSNEFERVDARPFKRGGILTQSAVLAATSFSTRTSPVVRGTWILENLLDAPPPPPPPDIPGLDQVSKSATVKLSVRQQLELHRKNAACAVCHNRIDPLGFALENYNAMGAFRAEEVWITNEKGKPTKVDRVKIDATGTLPSGESIQGVQGLKKLLTGAKKDDFLRCLTTKMMTYALGRGIDGEDWFAVNRVVSALAKDQDRSQALLKTIIRLDAFQKR